MKDDNKTKKQLIAELEDLRRRLGESGGASGSEEERARAAVAAEAGMTRRDVLRTAWVAPVILTVAAHRDVAMAVPVGVTTCAPTGCLPTPLPPPTMGPTLAPEFPTTAEPTTVFFPTAAPTTAAPTTAAPTTAAPTTAAPTTAAPTTAAPTTLQTGKRSGDGDFPTVDPSSFRTAAAAPTAAEDLFRFKS